MLAFIKTIHSVPAGHTPFELFCLVDGMMYYAWLVEVEFNGALSQGNESSQKRRLNETFRLLDDMNSFNSERIDSHWMDLRPKQPRERPPIRNMLTGLAKPVPFLVFAVHFRLSLYVIEQLTSSPIRSRVTMYSLLDAALQPERVMPIQLEEKETGPVKPVVLFLLEEGLDPNRHTSRSADKTMWVSLLKSCYERDTYVPPTSARDLCEIFRSFVEHGADPRATFTVEGREAPVTISQVLNKVLWDQRDISQIEELLQEKREASVSYTGCLAWFRGPNPVS